MSTGQAARYSPSPQREEMIPPILPMPEVPAEKLTQWRTECESMAAQLPSDFPAELEEHRITTGVAGCWLTGQLDASGCAPEITEKICEALGQISVATMDVANPWDLAQFLLKDWRSTGSYPRPGAELLNALLAKFGYPSGVISLMANRLRCATRANQN